MSYALPIAILIGLLILWAAAWRRKPILAFGITIGTMITWVAAAIVGTPDIESVPIWLPPLPIAVVAVTLFVFGGLAWVWGDTGTGRHGTDTGPDRGGGHGH